MLFAGQKDGAVECRKASPLHVRLAAVPRIFCRRWFALQFANGYLFAHTEMATILMFIRQSII